MSLRKAIVETARWAQQTVSGCDQFDAVGQVMYVARKVAEGKPISWCDTHEMAVRSGSLYCASSMTSTVHCAIRLRLLVDPPADARRTEEEPSDA